MTEAQIEKKLVAFCREHGLLTYKFASPSHRGVPDRIIMGGAKVMFLELKRGGQRPTAFQFRELARIQSAGLVATWACTYYDAEKIVREFFYLVKGL